MENLDEKIGDDIFEKARRDNKESLQELESLGNNNDAEALSKLAEIYLKEFGGEKQLPQKAMEFLHRAAAQDYLPALYRLGDFYCYGKGGLVPDSQKAIEYLTRAAELGETESYRLLAEIYHYGKGGIEADGYKVIDYMLKYAEAKKSQLPAAAPDSFAKHELKRKSSVHLTLPTTFICTANAASSRTDKKPLSILSRILRKIPVGKPKMIFFKFICTVAANSKPIGVKLLNS